MLRSASECFGVLHSPSQSCGVLRSPSESSGVLRSPSGPPRLGGAAAPLSESFGFLLIPSGSQSSRASAEQPRLESFVTSAKQAGRKLLLFTFSSMPISRAAMLRIVQRMLEHCQWPLAVLYVGSLPDEGGVDASLEAAAAALKEDGRFLEVGP